MALRNFLLRMAGHQKAPATEAPGAISDIMFVASSALTPWP
jgi:hypothetical protein